MRLCALALETCSDKASSVTHSDENSNQSGKHEENLDRVCPDDSLDSSLKARETRSSASASVSVWVEAFAQWIRDLDSNPDSANAFYEAHALPPSTLQVSPVEY